MDFATVQKMQWLVSKELIMVSFAAPGCLIINKKSKERRDDW